jgi:hypothetical protein
VSDLERPNADLYETGRTRRTHLPGCTNILKRAPRAHRGLRFFMRTRFSIGTPRSLQEAIAILITAVWRCLAERR